ncbi:MAG: DsbE family thiol:disulfide interchange protein [Rhodospirillaceae bacterium]|nr:DsbE family thiol:disulfide interchange protein [Magnetovibrio sp.]MAY65865.1 DsbE family thiol:disulfide interchange protein [Rhodospirillaceae bacterium]
MKSRLLYLLPLGLFLVLAIYFGIGLTKDPKIIPSALIDKPAPEFTLPPVAGGPNGDAATGFSTADLKKGEVSIVNVFASWCVPCRAEHPEINKLAKMGIVPVYGLNYKDTPEAARAWLDRLGDNYTATGADESGRVGIDWGVYGVPETFIVDGSGRIRFKHVGPIVGDKLEKEILPLIRSIQEADK